MVDKLAAVAVCVLLGLILAGMMAILVRLGVAGAVPKHDSSLDSYLISSFRAINWPILLAAL